MPRWKWYVPAHAVLPTWATEPTQELRPLLTRGQAHRSSRSAPPAPPEHIPVPPRWTCRACGRPWPCAAARCQLGYEYRADRLALVVYLGAQLQDAARDMPAVPPPALYRRFVEWAR